LDKRLKTGNVKNHSLIDEENGSLGCSLNCLAGSAFEKGLHSSATALWFPGPATWAFTPIIWPKAQSCQKPGHSLGLIEAAEG